MLSKLIRGSKGGKSDSTPLVLLALALLFLLPQSPLNLFSIFNPEQPFQWQGLAWKSNENFPDAFWEIPGIPGQTVSQSSILVQPDQSLKLNFRCVGGNNVCDAGFHSDFDVSSLEQVDFIVSSTLQSTPSKFGSASGTYSLKIGAAGISVSSKADGSGNPDYLAVSDKKVSVNSIRAIREGQKWKVYVNAVLVGEELLTTPIKLTYDSDVRNDGFSEANIQVYATFKSAIKSCLSDEVKLLDGGCKKLIRTCIDNNLNNICDADDPVVYKDPDTNAPVCADRDNNRVCDDIQSLFCKDSNANGICDSDEVKWYSTYCEDKNGNGICDGIEKTSIVCPKDLSPVCDSSTNITYPNKCFSDAYGVTSTTLGSCQVQPTIIRLDCTSGQVPTPSGYICEPETGWLIKTEKVYIDIFTDCRTLPSTEGYTCTNINGRYIFVKTEFVTIITNKTIVVDCRVFPPIEGYTCQQTGDVWVFTKTELKNIDCYSRGCPTGTLCQGGLCVESSKKCPTEVDCSTYGSDSSCDVETGLCVKTQYLSKDCSTLGCPSGSGCESNVCVKTSTVSVIQKEGQKAVFGSGKVSPTVIIVLLISAGGLIALARRKP